MEHKGEHCNQIITLRNFFHGRTVTTLVATGQDAFHQHFFPFTEGFRYVEVNNQQQLLETLNDSVCGIMIELVQGEGGVIALDKDYVAYVDQLCQDRGIRLIVDEVQTGIRWTETLLCCEQYNIRPDIITLAKGLGAGLPIGTVLMDEKTSEVFQPGHHGTTYGGNPIACAGAIEVLNQVCDENFLPDVAVKAAHIYNRVLAMPNVTRVSGLSLMIGIEIAEGLDSRKIAVQCAENGLMILTAKTKLRMLPPLNITLKEIDKGLDILFKCLSEDVCCKG